MLSRLGYDSCKHADSRAWALAASPGRCCKVWGIVPQTLTWCKETGPQGADADTLRPYHAWQ